MWKLTDLNEQTEGHGTLLETFQDYITTKNLNFILAQGKCLNRGVTDLGEERIAIYLEEYTACDFSMISLFNGKPSAPFIAANMDINKKMARAQFLIDFNREAEEGKASPFYSKILGAFATQFFQGHPEIETLWFPFTIENIVGSGMEILPMESGTAILR